MLPALVALVLAGPLGAAEPDRSPLLADGFLQKVKPSVKQMLTFTFNGPRLAIDPNAWGTPPKEDAELTPLREDRQPLHVLFTQVQSLGEMRSAGSSGGGNEWSRRFSGEKLSGALRTSRGVLLLLQFHEAGEGGRAIEYADDGKGTFRLQVTHPEGDMILLSQTPKGGFRGVAMLGKRTFAGQGESFADFYKQHRRVVETDMLPILAHFGIEPVLSPQDPRIEKAVLARLTRTSDSLEKAKKLLADLDSDQFRTREGEQDSHGRLHHLPRPRARKQKDERTRWR